MLGCNCPPSYGHCLSSNNIIDIFQPGLFIPDSCEPVLFLLTIFVYSSLNMKHYRSRINFWPSATMNHQSSNIIIVKRLFSHRQRLSIDHCQRTLCGTVLLDSEQILPTISHSQPQSASTGVPTIIPPWPLTLVVNITPKKSTTVNFLTLPLKWISKLLDITL